MDIDLRVRVLLSVQRALVGEITPEMRAVSVEWSPKEVLLRVFVDGLVADQIRDDFDASVVTQIMADFIHSERCEPPIEFEFIRVDDPVPIPNVGTFVFGRAGTSFQVK